MVLKTTFGQSKRWSLIRGTLGIQNEENNNLNLANKVLNREYVLILGGLNSGISLYKLILIVYVKIGCRYSLNRLNETVLMRTQIQIRKISQIFMK